ncbi:MAG: hypothetical protein JJT78_11350 [Leptospira sp.]|nr:hypothetical protein [Leptospira sp.]
MRKTAAKKSNNKKIPDRYSIKTSPTGSYITCLESPNLSVRIEKGRVFTESSGRKAPDRTIFLDGACDSPPFLDMKRQVYNLDHHTGIIRTFTLSTCEQAAILVLKGLDLTEKNWNIWANDPDLDTVLAIWVILNHLHFKGDEASPAYEIIPILRLEGLIDGLGLDLTHFTAFPKALEEETSEKIDILRKKEMSIKKSGKWEETDFLNYTIQTLKRIDELIFTPEDFKDFKGLDELARVELDEKTSAVVYSANMGIYEIEQHLNKVYGKNPGLIILQKSVGHYTIRKSDLFTPLDMNHIYDKLNLYDRYVTGRLPSNRWGGAGEIGGSPRETGTALQPKEIAQITREAFYKPNLLEQVIRISWIGFLGLGVALLSWLAIGFWRFSENYGFWILESMGLPLEVFTTLIVGFTAILFFVIGRKNFWFYGIRYPAGKDWWLFFPGIMLGALFGGAWIPDTSFNGGTGLGMFHLFVLLILPFSMELLFRGLLHGELIELYRTQRVGGEWFVSIPTIISAVIYSLVIVLSPIHYDFPFAGLFGSFSWISQLLGGMLLGLSAGLCRERSESIFPVWGFHTVAILLVSMILWVM